MGSAFDLRQVSRDFQSSGESTMPRGNKAKHASKQKRQADMLEHGYQERSDAEMAAKRRTWATLQKQTEPKPAKSGSEKKMAIPTGHGDRRRDDSGRAEAGRSTSRKAATIRKERAKTGTRSR
jgi:hypothetical protein